MPQDYEPQIIELEPESAPRTTAIILLVCGLMGVAFLMVNVFFTGPDPLQSESWPEQDDGNVQERGNILPNVWRGREEADEEEEVTDRVSARRTVMPPTTNPFQIPGTEKLLRPTMPVPQAPKWGTDPTKIGVPGAPGKPTVPGSTPTGGAAPGGSATPGR